MVRDGRQHIEDDASPQAGITRRDFERLYPKLVAVLRKQGAPYEDACDLAQRTLFEAHNGIHGFRRRSEFDTWVVSIAKKLLLQDRRNQKRLKRSAEIVPIDDSLAVESFEPRVIARDLLDRAIRLILELPEAQRQPLILLARGFKYREIAKILNCSENRVSSLVHQARKKLRRALRGQPVDSTP